MTRYLSIFAICAISLVSFAAAREPSANERSTLVKITEEFNRWTITGQPEAFVERFDVDTREEERELLIELATLDVDRSWGAIWAERGIKNAATELPKLPKEQFWKLYHKKTGHTHIDNPSFRIDKVEIRIYSVSIEQHAATKDETAYVIYSRLHDGFKPRPEQLWVLRCSKIQNDWKPWPNTESLEFIRAQVERARSIEAQKRQAEQDGGGQPATRSESK